MAKASKAFSGKNMKLGAKFMKPGAKPPKGKKGGKAFPFPPKKKK